jgi:polyhydroxyalkanoate synthesis regulator phasin
MFGRKVAIAIVTALIGVGLLGGAAFAGFAPSASDTFSLVPDLSGTATAAAAPKPGNDRLKAILDALVSKGVITQAQEDAILAAVKDAGRDKGREDLLRHVFASLFDQSATYLGTTPAELKKKLPGTSLAAIANATSGKSRDGLVASLTKSADDAIAKALADGKITKDQADKATAAVPDHIAKFVDHTYVKPTPRAVTPKVQMFIGDAMSATRTYLGLKPADLMTQLRAGKSLGEIANATAGKSRDGLIAAITAQANGNIDKAQQGGKLTADQATQLKAGLQTAVTQLVDRKGPNKPASR